MSGRGESGRLMLLLIDENVPKSVADFFADRGHEVLYVRDVLAAGAPDPVVAKIGDRLSAIVVTWDKDFDRLVKRVPEGQRSAFRRLGRISFRCREPHGRSQLERHIDIIEFHYTRALLLRDFRMIVQIQENAIKLL
jgi:predicted nuclease of predicted toxin-antitoxin system